jgi:hypothetical protein
VTGRILTALAVLLLLGAVPSAALDLSVEPEFPVQGEEARLVVTDGEEPAAGAVVRATYRPNSEVSTEEEIGVTDARGVLVWRPADAGMVQLDARKGDDSAGRAVSIRFPSPPSQGLVVLLIAGLILFGGNIRFVSRTLKARG